MREVGVSSVRGETTAARRGRLLNAENATLLLALLGAVDAAYLTFVHYDRSALVCTVGSCHTVQSSRYAVIAGIPIAILGLGMYLAVIALGLARRARPEWTSSIGLATFAILLAGTVYAAYLTYIEIWVIHAICQYCVASALLTLALLVIEGTGVYRRLMEVPEE